MGLNCRLLVSLTRFWNCFSCKLGTVKIKSRRESIAETQEQLKIKRLPEVLESSDESEESSGEFDNLSSEVTPSSSPRNIFNPMEKFEMAKLKNSLYRLGRPLISNEDDRKLWKVRIELFIKMFRGLSFLALASFQQGWKKEEKMYFSLVTFINMKSFISK